MTQRFSIESMVRARRQDVTQGTMMTSDDLLLVDGHFHLNHSGYGWEVRVFAALILPAARLLILQPVDDPMSAWKSFNANESNFKRLCRYYEARAEDGSRIDFRSRQTGMNIHILVHHRVPEREFKVLLARFFRVKSHENVSGNESVEMRVGDLEQADQLDSCRVVHPDYKALKANETNYKRLCRYHNDRQQRTNPASSSSFARLA